MLFVCQFLLLDWKIEDGKTHGNDNIQPTQIEAWHVYLWSIIGIFTHLILYWISLDQEFGSVWHLPINVPDYKISCFRQKTCTSTSL